MRLKAPMRCVEGNFRPSPDDFDPSKIEYDAAVAHALFEAMDRGWDSGLSTDARMIIEAYRKALINRANDLMWKWGYP